MLIINVRQRNVQIFGRTQNNFGGTSRFHRTQVEKHCTIAMKVLFNLDIVKLQS